MGKNKKLRKGAKGDESDSESEQDIQHLIDNPNSKKVKPTKNKEVLETSDNEETQKAENKKSNTKSKKASTENSDSDASVSKVQKSFAVLQVDDSASEQNNDSESDSSKPVKKDNVKNSKSDDSRTKDKGGKKGKKVRRKRDESDEDIEKVLAELEMEYSGVKPVTSSEVTSSTIEKDSDSTVNSKEKEKVESLEDADEESTVKSAAQKKKEKKEREKQKKLAAKKDGSKKQTSVEESNPNEATEDKTDVATEVGDKKKKKKIKKQVSVEEPETVDPLEDDAEAGEKDGKKKKKKGAKEKEEAAKDPKKGPGKKTIAAMQEALKKIKEEEERMKIEEEQRNQRAEEAELARLEAVRLDLERKEKKKQKEKERKERLKAEGKLLTAKQKADRARAEALIAHLKAQGVELPDIGERKPRLGTRVRPSKQKKDQPEELPETNQQPTEEAKVEVEIIVPPSEQIAEPEEDVKDAWDASSSEDDESEDATAETKSEKQDNNDNGETSSEADSEDDDDEDESEDSDSEDEDARTTAEKARDRALERIKNRKEEAEKNRTADVLRAAIVCVLGHVDTGKTKILDKLRRTNVQDGEAGGITQQIGATNVPIDAIKEQIKIVKGVNEMELRIPSLLIIDTPGHESFSNLRNRGSSLCDIAILVVDIMHGLEPQTIESINILKNRKTPFIVALNKIDRLYEWQTMSRKDIRDTIKGQAPNTLLEFEQRTKAVIVQFAEQGLNAALFYENPDIRSYVSLIPTSAITGEGMGNLLALIVEYCQTKLPKRLMYSDELQATVLEVKAIPGLGTTIDVILVNGTLREGDTMLCAGTDGPIVTQIRSLLMPQPMRELRVKNAYVEYKEIKAAQGVKIAAKELEKAIAGLNLYVAVKPDEVEVMKSDVSKELRSALSSIKLQDRGVYVQASTLGSLEALLEFLRTSKIPVCGIRIGPVVKKDVMKASIMLEHESQYATILAFDVKIERDAQELADTLGVKIFQADIIYHLFDKFMAYRDELKQKKREEFKHIAVFPCKMKILPQFVFNSRDPIVCGVMIEAGIVKEGTPICVPSKEFVELGIVTSIENNHKAVNSARKGMEVCIKIEPIPGESPKMFGRHFDETDMLTSKISRQSIDACKDYFRDDLLKTDWQLMVELKKIFQIM